MRRSTLKRSDADLCHRTAARVSCGAIALLIAAFASATSHAQGRNPYYQLQCSLSGAYCDRVQGGPPRRESFDESQDRRAREQALRRQQREAEQARQRAQREQELLAQQERQRQAQAAAAAERERQAQLTAARIESAPAFVRMFRSGWPVPQLILGGLLSAFAIVAGIGRNEFASPPGPGFLFAAGASLLCLAFTYGASAYTNPVATLLQTLFVPFLFAAFNALHFLRGWHHLFVSHPATAVAAPPLAQGALFPKSSLAQALRPDPTQLFEHPPAYQSQNLMQKAQALRHKIEADADIATAAMRRDRARAAKIEADAELLAARKKLPWHRRWMWW